MDLLKLKKLLVMVKSEFLPEVTKNSGTEAVEEDKVSLKLYS